MTQKRTTDYSDMDPARQRQRHYDRKMLTEQVGMALATLAPGTMSLEARVRTFVEEVDPALADYAMDLTPQRIRATAAFLSAWADALEAKQAR
jgi:hypothetical protein